MIDNPFTMIVLIVAIVFGAKVLRTRMLTRGRYERSADDERLMAHMQAQIETLSQRVQVLEKLVTDEDRKLASEIERLRGDARSGPQL